MKVIDLLNKIANGEEVPKKIKYEDDIYIHIGEYCYYCDDTNLILSDRMFAEQKKLNEIVEIIEEEKGIEKIIINSQGNIEKKLIDGSTIVLPTNKDEILHIAYKINELIDKVNKLKNK